MNLEEEKLKIARCIFRLRSDAQNDMLKERAEAYSRGADILEDYLKFLNRDGISYIFGERDL